MTAPITVRTPVAESAGSATLAPSSLGLRRRHLWLIPGLAIAIAANTLGEMNDVGLLLLIAFGIAPDVPRLLGSRGRGAHAVMHQPLVAAVALGAAVALTLPGVVPLVVLVAALVWFSHVVIGWGVGDVPRAAEARRHG